MGVCEEHVWSSAHLLKLAPLQSTNEPEPLSILETFAKFSLTAANAHTQNSPQSPQLRLPARLSCLLRQATPG